MYIYVCYLLSFKVNDDVIMVGGQYQHGFYTFQGSNVGFLLSAKGKFCALAEKCQEKFIF